MVVFPVIILSQPNYSYGCFVVGVVVVVGLWQYEMSCKNFTFVGGESWRDYLRLIKISVHNWGWDKPWGFA